MSEDGGITRLSIGFNKIAAVVKFALLIKVTPLYRNSEMENRQVSVSTLQKLYRKCRLLIVKDL